ncbi:lipid IV(A) 3-deoxy-D-manno-octulosonic acid transferase [Kangiella shandongensis]|uniref:lipid IV(A) 3-deoxy-D-manno-octulosonic acid transferase n=1 Tax=Kangiella shandongensis TaxID=2763258 RepID=UPI001CC03CCF|nr:lipid IV(A) 3-deoxy-D-manno-octulosonic acid transferase [Kangiella shandongensis]
MLRFIYTLVYYLCAPLLCIRWIYKSFKPPQYREPLRERFGFVKKQSKPSIWFHAVSMGEANAAKAIIDRLLQVEPQLNVVVTTTTPTGAKQIIEGLGDKVTHHYSPCDLPGAIKRFTRRVKPKALIIMETELWPNWLHHMEKVHIPVVLANARMSAKSASKYLKIASLSQQMMSTFERILPVGKEDEARFIKLGVSSDKCMVTGNIKFDQAFEQNGRPSFFPPWQEQGYLVWLAASTHKGEDELLLQAHQKVREELPDVKMVLVPRHPERFDEVTKLVTSYGFSFARRSQPEAWQASADVLVGDSMGELMLAYQLCDLAFVAGSLTPIGGHNMIEPASIGKPILSGPYVHNFDEIFHQLELHGGAVTVDSVDAISTMVIQLLKDREQRMEMGQKAKAVVEQSRGALDKTVEALRPFL